MARLWGFEEIRTPTFEEAGLFSRGVGENTDIVEKEMYVFTDRGGRQLALRPEGTACAVRAYLENNLSQKENSRRLFYIANMFRAERPQAGRYREFEQIGFEIFADPSPAADAELITLALAILNEYGLKNPALAINSIGCPNCRGPYRRALKEALDKIAGELCEDCQKRLDKNPLRCLDCKTCGPKAQAAAPAFALCAQCAAHESTVESLLRSNDVSFKKDRSIVRGLDYYTRTVFEISAAQLGAQNAVAGGGRYDGLVELLGGTPTPASGFALGVDRVIEAKTAGQAVDSARGRQAVFAVMVKPSSATLDYAFGIIHDLRKQGIAVFTPGYTDSMKSQMRQAGRSGAELALIVGDEECQNQRVVIKELGSGQQETVIRAQLSAHLKNRLNS